MGRSAKGRLLILLALAGGLVGVAGYLVESEPSSTGRHYLPNSGGPVLFDHRAHTDLADGCESCHHDLLFSDSRYDCSTCHDEDVIADDFDHGELKSIEAHSCGSCHKLDETAQAQSCRGCHPSIQESDDLIIACTQCHDADYTADLLTHDEMLEVHAHSCESCHYSRSIGIVYHEQCNRCHAIENRALFITQDGDLRCAMCHLK